MNGKILLQEEIPALFAEAILQLEKGRAGPRAQTLAQRWSRFYQAFLWREELWICESGEGTRNELRHYNGEGRLLGRFPCQAPPDALAFAQVGEEAVLWYGKQCALMVLRGGKLEWQPVAPVKFNGPPEGIFRHGSYEGQLQALLNSSAPSQTEAQSRFEGPPLAINQLYHGFRGSLGVDFRGGLTRVVLWPAEGPAPVVGSQRRLGHIGTRELRLAWSRRGDEPTEFQILLDAKPLVVAERQCLHDDFAEPPQPLSDARSERLAHFPDFANLNLQRKNCGLWRDSRQTDAIVHHFFFDDKTGVLEWEAHRGRAIHWWSIRPRQEWSLTALRAPVPQGYLALDAGEVALGSLTMVWAQCVTEARSEPPVFLVSFWEGNRSWQIDEVREVGADTTSGPDVARSEGIVQWARATELMRTIRERTELTLSAEGTLELSLGSTSAPPGYHAFATLELRLVPQKRLVEWLYRDLVDVT